MKKDHFKFYVILLLLLPQIGSSQWVRTNGPYKANVRCLAVSGTTVFAGTGGGGVFRSSNYGGEWSSVNDGITDFFIYALSASGPKILAGTSNGVFISSNQGSSWRLTSTGLPNSRINAVASNSTFDFAATNGNGIFRSSTNGTRWEPANTGLGNLYVFCLLTSGDTVLAGTWTSSGGACLWRSTNSGANWTSLVANQSATFGNAFTRNSTYLFAATDVGLFRSSDNGDSWTQLAVPVSWGSGITSLAARGANIFAGNDRGDPVLVASTDNGQTWTTRSSGLIEKSIWALTLVDTFVLAGGYSQGVFRTSNNGINWIQSNSGLSGTAPTAIAALGSKLLTSTSSSAVFASTDNGVGWHSFFDNLNEFGGLQPCYYTYNTSAMLVSGSSVYLGTYGAAFTSQDSGSSWYGAVVGVCAPVSSFALAPTRLFAGTNGNGVFRSTDNGNSFEWPTSGTMIWNVTALALIGGSLLAGTDTSSVFVSTDNGNNWVSSTSGMPSNSRIRCLALVSPRVFAGTANGVFVSTNNGSSWSRANLGLIDSSVTALIVKGSNIFAGTASGGVFLSTDFGGNWSGVNSGLPATIAIRCFGIKEPYLYVGTPDKGIWRRPLSEMITTVDRTDNALPSQFGLGQNYPNPFNPTTRIEFRLPASNKVTLSIFDMLGRKTATLVDEQLTAGAYSIEWNASGFASGVYYYQLRAGDFSQTKRLLLLR